MRLSLRGTAEGTRGLGIVHMRAVQHRLLSAPMRGSGRYPKIPDEANRTLDITMDGGSSRAGMRGRSVGGTPCRRSGRQRDPQSSVGLSRGAGNLVKLDDDRSLCGLLTTTESTDHAVRGLRVIGG